MLRAMPRSAWIGLEAALAHHDVAQHERRPPLAHDSSVWAIEQLKWATLVRFTGESVAIGCITRWRVRADVPSRTQRLIEFDEDALAGAVSAASITCWCRRRRHPGQAARAARVVERVAVLGHVGDAVLELHEHVGAVVDAQAVAGAEVLVDPHPHGSCTDIAVGYPRPPPAESPSTRPSPPAQEVAHTWHRPTGDVDDPWAWLPDRDDPDTVAYLEAENAYADAWFAPHAALRDAIFDEIKQPDAGDRPVGAGPQGSVVVRQPHRRRARNYPIHCRGATAGDGDARTVLLDENAEARATTTSTLGAFDVSPGHGLLAWSSDTAGTRSTCCASATSTTGTELADRLERHLLRHGVVGRRAHGSSTRARRGDAPAPGVAPPPRHGAGRRRPRAAGGRRALLPRRRRSAGSGVGHHHLESKQSAEVWVLASDEPAADAPIGAGTARRATSTRSNHGATGS